MDAARRVLANRDHFELDAGAVAEWDAINARRARDLPGLREPSPTDDLHLVLLMKDIHRTLNR